MSGHICANNILSVPEHWRVLVRSSIFLFFPENFVWHQGWSSFQGDLRTRSKIGRRSWRSDQVESKAADLLGRVTSRQVAALFCLIFCPANVDEYG